MDAELPGLAATPDDEQPPPIRRGQGLHLSGAVPDDQIDAVPPPGADVPPVRRGQGLRLSVAAAPDTEIGIQSLPDAGAPPDKDALDVPPVLRQLRLAHGTVSYRQAGSGPPLLLIHGWGASSRYWFGALERLAAMRTCYALDLPGFGESPALVTPASIARLSELVVESADALGLEQFDLNGHSFGGCVAAHLAAHWPERVRRLVLTSCGTHQTGLERALLEAVQRPAALVLRLWQPCLNLWQPWLDLCRPAMATLISVSPIHEILGAWFMERVPANPELLREGVADLLRMDLRAHLACIASVGDPALTAAFGAIRRPTLLVGGRQDRATPPEAVAAAHALVPGSRLAWIEGCGHVPMIERPSAYYQAVRDFLEEHSEESPRR